MMDDNEIVKIIEGQLNDGIGSDLGDISDTRQEIFDRYMGELYGDELDGESKVTTRDIQETIEWAMPPLLRHFTAGSDAVTFEADDPEDEDAAEQETHAVRQQFWKDNSGFTVLYLAIKTVLMNPNGYVKVWREKKNQVTFDHYQDLDLTEIEMIQADPEMEIVGQDENDRGLYDVKVKRTSSRGRNLVASVPEDEVVIDGDWAHLDLDECPFVSHSPDKTHSELLEMGYDADDLEDAYTAGGETYNSEETNRRTYSDETYSDDETHKALRKYRYHECSMLLDVDEDGIAERRRVVMIGKKIFDNEEDDDQPIIAGATILMPHKHTGISMAQLLLDLQEIKTIIWRQTLNNMYRANNPRTIALKGANMSDLLSQSSNGILRAKNVGDITMEPTAPIIGQVLPLLGMIDETRDYRSGISKTSTVPDPEMLKNSAEGSFLAMVEKADQRVDLLARLIGETLVKRIYIKLHGLIQRHSDTKWMKLPGGWVQVDPTQWRRRDSMTCKIGLGYPSAGQRLQAASMIKADHDMLVQQGSIADPEKGRVGLVTLQHVYNGRKLMIEALGEEVSVYYQDPSQIQKVEQQPPPDVNLLMIQSNERIEQGKRQVDMMKMQQAKQKDQIELQAKYALEERKMRFEEMEGAYERQIEQIKGQMDAAAAADKGEVERLKLELSTVAEELDNAQVAEKLEVERFKAQLSADTQVLLKQMDLGEEQIPVVDQLSQSQGALEQQQQSINQALQTLSSLISEMRQPKEIIYDESGEIVGVRNSATGEARPIRRGPGGEPIGIG